jgi:filamentous hemagglutinin family protein
MAMVAAWLLIFSTPPSWSNSNGGIVVGGQATITQKPAVTTIDQTTDRAIINWKGFSIDKGELTKFNQPGTNSVALNRVTGGDPSTISGQLQANGHVWLVNRNGILFGPTAQVDVHWLLATTADIADQDFMKGLNNFSIPSPNPDASVVNMGTITIGEYGLAGLVAPHVRNDGLIQGRLGQVVNAIAPAFTLDFYGESQAATSAPSPPVVH